MKKSKGIFIGGLILLVCVVLFICFKFGGSSTVNSGSKSIENLTMDMCKAIEEREYDEYNSYLDKAYSKYNSVERETMKVTTNRIIDYINSKYGPNVEISFDINEKKDMLAKLEENGNKEATLEALNFSDAKELYAVAYTYTISGDGGSDSSSGTTIIANVDGKWYPASDIILNHYLLEIQ